MSSKLILALAVTMLVATPAQSDDVPRECREQYDDLLDFSAGRHAGESDIYLKWFHASGDYVDCVSQLAVVEGRTEGDRVPKCHAEFSSLYNSYWSGVADLGPEAYYDTSLKATAYVVCVVTR